jgi:serine protease AprX
MKSFLLILLTSSLAVAQTTKERQIILQKSTRNTAELTQKLAGFEAKNKQEVQAYLLQNPNTPNPDNIQFILDGKPIYYGIDSNEASVQTLRAQTMYPGGTLGINATGQGLTVGVWDGEKVRFTHQEFGGRVTSGDNANVLSAHATHVTGTILAAGVSASRKGFAYQANAKSYEFNSDISEMNAFAGDGNLVSNHSYGLIAGNLPTYFFGQYNSQAANVDELIYNYPYYIVVKSAGNDRSSTTLAQVQQKQGYDLLTGMSCSKNNLTVAAVKQQTSYSGPESVEITNFSNFGPPDDGRIKPDIAAMGFEVNSCNSGGDASYTTMSGTSMSAPAISGLITLLQHHYTQLNPSTYMLASTVRGLICHSAREAGLNTGPDYEFGWGLADGFTAAQIISNRNSSSILDERVLNNNQTYTTTFTISQTQDLNVTLAWTDPAGLVNSGTTADVRTPRLVNNLDIKVIKDGIIYYPWRLDPTDVFAPASNNSDNNVDNIERVEIFNATPGVYTIQINHKGTLTNGLQEYSLIASGSQGLTLSNNSFDADNTFFVYPNPAQNEIHFNNPKGLSLDEVSIFDITGKMVLSAQGVTNNTLDVSRLQSGVYMVKIASQGATFVRKFTKN